MSQILDSALDNELKTHLEAKHACIVCASISFQSFAKQGYLEALKCNDCGMISVNPHFSDTGLNIFYSKYFGSRQQDNLLKQQRDITYEIDRNWLELFTNRGRILDVGCSGGFFLSKFDKERWQREGVEIGADAAAFAKKEFGIPVKTGYVADLNWDYQFDVLSMRGVIEHFRNPIEVLKKCSELIKPGGHLFITATPAGDSFAFDVYREKWRLFTPYEHIHFFSLNILNDVMKRFGLNYVAHNYQYAETPYANPPKDFEKIKKDIVLTAAGKSNQVESSVPFPGSMITAIWQKT